AVKVAAPSLVAVYQDDRRHDLAVDLGDLIPHFLEAARIIVADDDHTVFRRQRQRFLGRNRELGFLLAEGTWSKQAADKQPDRQHELGRKLAPGWQKTRTARWKRRCNDHFVPRRVGSVESRVSTV